MLQDWHHKHQAPELISQPLENQYALSRTLFVTLSIIKKWSWLKCKPGMVSVMRSVRLPIFTTPMWKRTFLWWSESCVWKKGQVGPFFQPHQNSECLTRSNNHKLVKIVIRTCSFHSWYSFRSMIIIFHD